MAGSLKSDAGLLDRSMHRTLAIVLAGGRGTRLGELTSTRCKPAVPFAGRYRIIDFTLSNCLNSGIRQISILTQYRSHSLNRHIEKGWSLFREEFGEFIELLPAEERHPGSFRYRGTADAVFKNLDIIRDHKPELVLVLAGDHVYKMDYREMVARHLLKRADMTIGCVEVPIDEAGRYGIMQVDADDRVVGFVEKPAAPRPTPGNPAVALASMGIYLFDPGFLEKLLETASDAAESQHDFGHDILPMSYPRHRVYANPFRDPASGAPAYWRDVGTLDSYWRANLEMAQVTPPLNLYDADWPLRSAPLQLPPAKFVFNDSWRRGMALDSLVGPGCILSGARVERSVLSTGVRIEQESVVSDSVILPDVHIGAKTRIRRAVIDSGCRIADNSVIGFDAEADRQRYFLSPEGVVLVCAPMLAALNRRRESPGYG